MVTLPFAALAEKDKETVFQNPINNSSEGSDIKDNKSIELIKDLLQAE